MTIDKIYIDNFGKLSNLTVVPKEGLNIIYAPNESGKSTLLSFIKYMFYGTKIKKAKGDMTFKEKYMPWNGTPMSGSIEFTHGGKKYIITRSDGAKNGSRKLEVKELLTGVLLNIEEPGRHFFSVGEKAFSDSLFVTDIFSVTDSDDDILTLLSNSGADTASYTRVRDALEEKILSLSSPKRSSSELTILNRRLGEEMSKQVNVKKELGDITLSKSTFDNKKEQLKAELSRLDNIISKRDLFDALQRYNELGENLKSEKSNYENIKTQIDALLCTNTEKSDKKKNYISAFSFCGIFALVSFIIFFIFRNIFLSISLFACSTVLRFVFSKRKLRQNATDNSQISALTDTLKTQAALSLKRICEIEDSLLEMKKTHPDIFQDKNSCTEQINSFTTDELNAIIQNREKCADELKALEMRIVSLEKRYSHLLLELDAINLSLDNLNIRISEVESKVGLYNMAMSILDKSFAILRDEFAPKLCAEAFGILSSVSDGDCTGLVSNEHFEASVKINNEYKDVKFLSDGTQSLVYLAIRIAMCRYLSPNDAVPIFFDDVLSGFDDERCLKMMNLLGELSSERQIFLCSCRGREAIIPKNSNNASLISIRKDDTNGQCRNLTC